MTRFRHFGLVFDSEFDIEGVALDSGDPDVTICRGVVSRKAVVRTLNEETSGFRDFGAFRVSGGCAITVDLVPGADPQLLRVLLLGRLTAQILRQRGWFPLHASSVRIGDAAAAFVAPSGTGKSTLAAALHARGHEVLSDDIAPVRIENGRCLLLPGSPSIRLQDQAANFFPELAGRGVHVYDKLDIRLPVRPNRPSSFPLARIYSIVTADETAIAPVDRFSAVQILGRDCFIRLGRTAPDLVSMHLRNCTELASLGILRYLRRPRGRKWLDLVVRAIEEDGFRMRSDEQPNEQAAELGHIQVPIQE